MKVARFLLRRLLIAVPTLLGICLITFAMIHLPPGDPLATSLDDPSTSEDRRGVRRLYFLDLPVFYNSNPRGLEARVERLQEALLRDRKRGLAAVRRCGTTCLPALSSVLAQTPHASLREAVARIRNDHPNLGTASASTSRWLTQVLPLLAPSSLEPLASKLGLQKDAASTLQDRGAAALAAVMTVLLASDEDATVQAASDLASDLTGVEGRVAPSTPAATRARTLAMWSEWWYQRRRDHVTFSAWERVQGRVTETRFAKWMGRLLTFRFGASTHDGRPVTAKLAETLPVTLLLSLLSMALAYLLAVPLGVHAAVRRGTLTERVTTVTLFVLYSLPPFWVAMLLILLLGGVGYLDLFPIYGLSSQNMAQAGLASRAADLVHHLVLPVACLSYGSLALISRYQRNAMIEVIHQDYILAARARGLSERTVIFKHALRNALLPVITLAGLQVPYLISGSVIIERIFNIPGMGLLTFEAFLNRDYPVIMAVSVLTALLTLAGLILSDLAYALADPRISLEDRS